VIKEKSIDRRVFLSLVALCSTTLSFGATEEFIPSQSPILKASPIIRSLLDKLNAVQNQEYGAFPFKRWSNRKICNDQKIGRT